MLNFIDIDLTHRKRATELFRISDFKGAEYSFTTQYIWRKTYKSKLCFYKDFLFIRSLVDNNGEQHPYYMFPVGKGDIKEAIELLIEDAREMGKPFTLSGVFAEQKSLIEDLFPDRFKFSEVRDFFDYIYSANDLITLAGKKFQAKRNHANYFKRQEGWSYEDINEANIAECLKMSRVWCAQNMCPHNFSLASECCSVNEAINNFKELELKGGLLRKDGNVIAFSIGEMLTGDMFLVHIEKAFAEYRGAYPVISQEFLSHNINLGFIYVNREDDAGQEGLRKAKLQNNPLFLLEKWLVTE